MSGTPLTYVYDAAGRLESVSDSSGVLATYTYDAQNLRTKKVVTGGAATHYVYGAGGLLSGEYDNTGGLIREYVYHYGEPVAQIDGGVSETLIYLHTDHLGTPRVASNSSGTQVWSWDSDAFGVGAPTGTADVNLRFAGQYFDAESGLHYNWNRYYNPATGRYVSSDPIGLGGGINTFGYSFANPVMFIDPEGLEPTVIDLTNPECANTGGVPKDHRCYNQNGHQAAADAGHPKCDVVLGHVNEDGVLEDHTDGTRKPADIPGIIEQVKEANPDSECIICRCCQSERTPAAGGPSVAEQLDQEAKKQIGEHAQASGSHGNVRYEDGKWSEVTPPGEGVEFTPNP